MSLERDLLKTNILELIDDAERTLTVICGLMILIPVVCSVMTAVFNIPTVAEISLLFTFAGSLLLPVLVRKILLRPFMLTVNIRELNKLKNIEITPELAPIHYLFSRGSRELKIIYTCSMLNVLSGKISNIIDSYIARLFSINIPTEKKYVLIDLENLRILYAQNIRRIIRKWKLVLVASLITVLALMPPLILVLSLVNIQSNTLLVFISSIIPLLSLYISVKVSLNKVCRELERS